MKVYVYIDESGSIHKNSKTKYFAVGGYITINDDKNRVISKYKKNNLEFKRKHNLDLKVEIKSYDMNQDEKIEIFNNVQKIKSFCGFALICNKNMMKKEIIQSNIFFNYAVKLIFKDCIIPILSKEFKEFIVCVDNRNIKVGNLKDLENYLNTEFCLENMNFKVTYCDSKINYGIQLADLIVNTFYNSFKNIKIVENVINSLKNNKFRTSLFPEYKIMGRNKKIAYNSIKNN